jgi:fucose 4-O-acetylase-like acetyltransferase
MDPFNSQFILNEKRWLWIDYDKGISIILVGFGHCYGALSGYGLSLAAYPFFNYFGVFFFGFRMPLFFIVSGLLVAGSLNKKGLGAYIGDRSNNILYPLLVWGFIETTFQIIISRWFPQFSNSGHIGPKTYFFLIINPDQTGHFWYLNALFFIGAIYATLKTKLKLKPVVQVILGLILFSASAYLHIHNLHAGILNHVFEYYIFFALGDLISGIMLNEQYRQKYASWKVFFPLMAVFLVTQFYCTRLILAPHPEGINYIEHKLPFLFLIEALIGCAISINCSFLLQRYRKLTFLRIVGFHSLFIYCMQIIVMIVARMVFMNALHITNVPALIMLVWASGIVLPIFIYNYCLKHKLWWLYTFRKPEKQVEYIRFANIFRPRWARNMVLAQPRISTHDRNDQAILNAKNNKTKNPSAF